MPIYMNFEGVKGDVTVVDYKGWIELESCQFGMTRPMGAATGTGGNREAAAPAVSEIVVTKYLDSSSNGLVRQSLWGEGKKVEIHFLKTGDAKPYLVITLEYALISNYSVSGHGGAADSVPMETLSLNFTKIEYLTRKDADVTRSQRADLQMQKAKTTK